MLRVNLAVAGRLRVGIGFLVVIGGDDGDVTRNGRSGAGFVGVRGRFGDRGVVRIEFGDGV